MRGQLSKPHPCGTTHVCRSFDILAEGHLKEFFKHSAQAVLHIAQLNFQSNLFKSKIHLNNVKTKTMQYFVYTSSRLQARPKMVYYSRHGFYYYVHL